MSAEWLGLLAVVLVSVGSAITSWLTSRRTRSDVTAVDQKLDDHIRTVTRRGREGR